MHPILFRIPLPQSALPLCWVLLVAAGLAALVARVAARREETRQGAIGAGVVAVGLAAVGVLSARARRSDDGPAAHLQLRRDARAVARRRLVPDARPRRARRAAEGDDGEQLRRHGHRRGRRLARPLHRHEPERVRLARARCSRCAAAVSSRTAASSAASSDRCFFLRQHKIPLLPWADVAVPSLASGLMITRIGCYLFGCDFGKPLSATAPAWLQKLGTFPHWRRGHARRTGGRRLARLGPAREERSLVADDALASLPVHPTQLYESLVGASLLALLLLSRRTRSSAGRSSSSSRSRYGVCRFVPRDAPRRRRARVDPAVAARAHPRCRSRSRSSRWATSSASRR